MTRETSKEELVNRLHSFVRSYNKEIGLQSGMPEDQVESILDAQDAENKRLCEHLFDMLVVEGYVERS